MTIISLYKLRWHLNFFMKGEIHMDDIGKLIKMLRLKKEMTLKDVAEKTGLSIGFLSQVERGKSSITLQSISKISDALEVSRSYFFKDEVEPTKIKQNHHQKNFKFHNSNFVYQTLSGDLEHPTFEPMLVVLLPTNSHVSASTHSGQEFVYVLEGTLTVIIEDEETDLEAGSSFHIDSATPHTWYNNTSEPVRLLYVYSRV